MFDTIQKIRPYYYYYVFSVVETTLKNILTAIANKKNALAHKIRVAETKL